MLKHYVEFDEPGALFPESSTRQVETRIPAELKKIPQYCYALHYYSREEIPAGKMLCAKDLEFVPSEIGMRKVCQTCKNRFKCATDKPVGEIIVGKEKNKSPRILFGTKYTPAQIKKENGGDRICRNLENMDAKYGVKCFTGNWQPLLKGEIVLASHADLKGMIKVW